MSNAAKNYLDSKKDSVAQIVGINLGIMKRLLTVLFVRNLLLKNIKHRFAVAWIVVIV